MQGHEEWLELAKEDLRKAKYTLRGNFYRGVMFDCQQASEKALKAYLAFKNKPVIKTHDLIKLLESCTIFDNEFKKKDKAAGDLNPLSTKFRYPADCDVPDYDDAKLAIKHASSIVRLVTKKISEPDTGQKNIF